MRIIVNGQRAFGHAVLKALLDRGEDVVGVFTAPDREGQPPDPLKACALDRGIPVFQPESFEPAEVFEQMEELAPDLAVMTPALGVTTPFVPDHVLCLPTHGTIQYHPSLLPMHKGPSCVNWPIIYGEKKTGLSIFWPDEGHDTGPVLLQKEVEIGPDDTLGSTSSVSFRWAWRRSRPWNSCARARHRQSRNGSYSTRTPGCSERWFMRGRE